MAAVPQSGEGKGLHKDLMRGGQGWSQKGRVGGLSFPLTPNAKPVSKLLCPTGGKKKVSFTMD